MNKGLYSRHSARFQR